MGWGEAGLVGGFLMEGLMNDDYVTATDTVCRGVGGQLEGQAKIEDMDIALSG